MSTLRYSRPLVVLAIAAGAACKSVFSELEPDADKVPLSEIVDVSRVGTGDLRANGTDTVRVLLQLPGRASNRVVKLTTSAGLWVESGTAELSVRTTPDSAGEKFAGAALLRAPRDTVVRLAVIRATVGDSYYDTVSVRFIP